MFDILLKSAKKNSIVVFLSNFYGGISQGGDYIFDADPDKEADSVTLLLSFRVCKRGNFQPKHNLTLHVCFHIK